MFNSQYTLYSLHLVKHLYSNISSMAIPPPLPPPCRLHPNTETTLESSLLQEEVEEEEVWLYWIDSHKEPHGKSIRHLAQDAKGNHKMDVDIITYYRCQSVLPDLQK